MVKVETPSDSEEMVKDEPPKTEIAKNEPDHLNVPPAIPSLDNVLPDSADPAPPKLAQMEWKEINGLLTQNDFADPGAARAVQARGPSFDPAKRTIAWRTMPSSRAEAELADGGRIVLAGDTGMLLASGGKRGRVPELWDGRAAERIADLMLSELKAVTA